MNEGGALPIIVAGSGPAGLIAALSLAAEGFRVALVGPLSAGSSDRRTTALMAPSLAHLARLGLAGALEQSGTPLRTMRIVDATGRLFRAPTVTFRAAEIGEPFFGLNLQNAHLNEVLEGAVAAQGLIERHEGLVTGWTTGEAAVTATLADGTRLEARLAVAADGRESPARAASGIAVRRKKLAQAALVLNFGHARDHEFASTEFHTDAGPFTQVPLPGRRSSLVWVARPAVADLLAALPDTELSLRVEEQMQSMLGRIEVEPGRQVYPLGSLLPERFAARRIALIGEAAHVFAPIGAQGLNLGIRDVEDLVASARLHRDDPGAPAALAAYDGRRRPDVLGRSGAVALLNHSLLSGFPPWQLLRGAGLGALAAFGPLRAYAMREGMRPGSGLSSFFRRSREEVGR